MKGQATITVKDKNGNIKTSVKQHNKIFNMPQILLQDLADNSDIYLSNTFSEADKDYAQISLKNYFRRLTAHSEDLSLTDPYDFKFPELVGGYTAATGHSEYANASVYNVTDDKITLTWAWTPTEQKTIKSIALHSKFDSSTAFSPCKKIKNDMILVGNELYKKSIGLSNNGYKLEQISGVFAPSKDDNILIRRDGNKLYFYDTTIEANIKEIGNTHTYTWYSLFAYHYPDGGYFIEAVRYYSNAPFYYGFTFDDDGNNFQSTTSKIDTDYWLQINNRYVIKPKSYFDMDTEKEVYRADAFNCGAGFFDKNALMLIRDTAVCPIPMFNTTALNLSAPVTVEAGETITITYEITATE